MAIKNFKHPENQELWDKFYQYKLQSIKEGEDINKIKMSANQYKPVLLQLEEVTDRLFTDITPNNLNNLSVLRNGRSMNHVTGFFITAINQGWMKGNKELIVYLIPKEYRQLVQNLT